MTTTEAQYFYLEMFFMSIWHSAVLPTLGHPADTKDKPHND